MVIHPPNIIYLNKFLIKTVTKTQIDLMDLNGEQIFEPFISFLFITL